MDNNIVRDRNGAQTLVGAGVELEGALVLKLAKDVLLHLLEGALGVHQMVVEDFAEGLEGIPSLFFEDAVAAFGEFKVVVGGALFMELTKPGATDLIVVFADIETAFELALDGCLFIHEERHNVNGWVAEMGAERRRVKLAAQGVHTIHQKFQALHLNLGAREAIKDHAVAVFR